MEMAKAIVPRQRDVALIDGDRTRTAGPHMMRRDEAEGKMEPKLFYGINKNMNSIALGQQIKPRRLVNRF